MAANGHKLMTPESEIRALYRVAAGDHLGLSQSELESLKTGDPSGLSDQALAIYIAIERINGRWAPSGRMTSQAREDLAGVPTEILDAIDAVGVLIQPLPWPEEP